MSSAWLVNEVKTKRPLGVEGLFYATGRDKFQDRPNATRGSLFASLGNHIFQLKKLDVERDQA